MLFFFSDRIFLREEFGYLLSLSCLPFLKPYPEVPLRMQFWQGKAHDFMSMLSRWIVLSSGTTNLEGILWLKSAI